MDILTYAALNKKVEEAKNVFDEKISESVNAYLDKNPPTTGATAEQAAQIDKSVADINKLKGDMKNIVTEEGSETDATKIIYESGSEEIEVPTMDEFNSLKGDLDKLNEGGLVIKDEVIAEDINNWLDEHPEATIDFSVSAIVFDSVEEMKNYSGLKAGDRCRTLGYHSANDGGGAYYFIRNKKDTEKTFVTYIERTGEHTTVNAVEDEFYNGGLTQILSAQNLVAEMIVESGVYNVRQFGAIGDGVTDDAPSIRLAIMSTPNDGFTLYFPSGVYIQGDGRNTTPCAFEFCEKLNFNILGYGATIVANPNNACTQDNKGFRFVLCDNGNVEGITYNGSIQERKPDMGDNLKINAQSAFHLVGSTNMTFTKCTALGACMDGWCLSACYYNGSEFKSNRCTLINCIARYCYRQGMSVVRGSHGIVIGCEFTDTGIYYGTDPMAGVDIESDVSWSFKDCKLRNNLTGIALAGDCRDTMIEHCEFDGDVMWSTTNSNHPNIHCTITNCTFRGTGSGIEFIQSGGYIISNNLFENADKIFLNDNYYDTLGTITRFTDNIILEERESSAYTVSSKQHLVGGINIRWGNGVEIMRNTFTNVVGSFSCCQYGAPLVFRNNTLKGTYDLVYLAQEMNVDEIKWYSYSNNLNDFLGENHFIAFDNQVVNYPNHLFFDALINQVDRNSVKKFVYTNGVELKVKNKAIKICLGKIFNGYMLKFRYFDTEVIIRGEIKDNGNKISFNASSGMDTYVRNKLKFSTIVLGDDGNYYMYIINHENNDGTSFMIEVDYYQKFNSGYCCPVYSILKDYSIDIVDRDDTISSLQYYLQS